MTGKIKAIALSKDVLTSLNVQITKHNMDCVLNSLNKYGFIKLKEQPEKQCEGQMNIYDFPEYLPNDLDFEK